MSEIEKILKPYQHVITLYYETFKILDMRSLEIVMKALNDILNVLDEKLCVKSWFDEESRGLYVNVDGQIYFVSTNEITKCSES